MSQHSSQLWRYYNFQRTYRALRSRSLWEFSQVCSLQFSDEILLEMIYLNRKQLKAISI